ncbi:MAG: amidohydrolase [Planctomycetaceae bacterium]|nr:amidohydrolase [Planctomycetaceae bacterium]
MTGCFRRSWVRPAVLVACICALSPALIAGDAAAWVDHQMDDLVALYTHFHQHPELSFQEEQTAERMAEELRAAGCDVTTNVGGHGVVGRLRNGDGPTLMLRSDLDALPVTEETGLPFASQVRAINEDGDNTGVMHACGHDVHMTNLIAVARYLSAHRDEWQGTVLLVGQPAEELGAGAQAMLEDGLFERFPRPDFAVALHVDSFVPAGMVGYRSGYSLANVDSCDITLKGRGGHGAFPQGCIDPIAQAAQLIVDLQTIVSREISALEPAVVTVGSIHGGTKHNVIPDTCHLQLTIRSYSPEVRKHLQEAIRRKALAIAQSFRAPEPVVEFDEGTPSLFNDERLTERLAPVLMEAVGEENVVRADRSMGGEDFSRYGAAGVPIMMYKLGSVTRERLSEYAALGRTPPSLHSSKYYPDIRLTLRTGVVSMTAIVRDLLPVRTP